MSFVVTRTQRRSIVGRLRSMLRHVQRVSAGFLVIAGVYITWFWIDDLSSDTGDEGQAAGVIEGWSAALTNWVQDNSAPIGLLLAGGVAIAVLSTVLKRFEPPTPAESPNRDTRELAEIGEPR